MFDGGTMILTGDNTYTGGTTICFCSTVQIGNGGTTGSIIGDINNGGTLIFNRSNSYTFGGVIRDDGPDAGTVVQAGTGTTILTGINTYFGGTHFNAGKLSVASDDNLGDVAGSLTFNGGVLQVTGTTFNSTARTINWGNGGGGFDIADAGNTFTVSQALGGLGGLTKLGAGTLVLSGTNTYSGGTEITGGSLVAGSATALGAGDVFVGAGTLVCSAPSTLSIGGALTILSGANLTLQVGDSGAGRISAGGTVTLTGGTLTVNFKPGFAPSVGDTLSVVKGASLRGKFSAISVTGFKVTPTYTSSEVLLHIDG